MANEVIPFNKLAVDVTAANVQITGLEELKSAVRLHMKELTEFPVQEETYKGAKAYSAEGNKLIKKIHEVRMKTKSKVLGNYEAIDADLLDFENELKGNVKNLSGRIKDYDDEKKQLKLEAVQSEIRKLADAGNVDAELITLDKRWLNKTYSWTEMQEEIGQQITVLQEKMSQLAANTKTVDILAKALDLESDGFKAMLNGGSSIESVQIAMENAVEARKMELKVKQEQQEVERQKHEQEVADAVSVGDKLVNSDTGEVVDPLQEPVSNYQYTFFGLTSEQKAYMDSQFSEWGVVYNVKEVF
ncbi:DUF1351 domain-containing protein [Weissella tructae]